MCRKRSYLKRSSVITTKLKIKKNKKRGTDISLTTPEKVRHQEDKTPRSRAVRGRGAPGDSSGQSSSCCTHVPVPTAGTAGPWGCCPLCNLVCQCKAKSAMAGASVAWKVVKALSQPTLLTLQLSLSTRGLLSLLQQQHRPPPFPG